MRIRHQITRQAMRCAYSNFCLLLLSFCGPHPTAMAKSKPSYRVLNRACKSVAKKCGCSNKRNEALFQCLAQYQDSTPSRRMETFPAGCSDAMAQVVILQSD